MTTPPEDGSGYQPPAPSYPPPVPSYEPPPPTVYPPPTAGYPPGPGQWQPPPVQPQGDPYAPVYQSGWEVYPDPNLATPAPPRRRWILVAAATAAVMAIGIAVAVAVSGNGSSQPSEAALCNRAEQGAGIMSSLMPGASVSVTTGGSPLAGMPTPPDGATARCTMTLTISGQTLTGYIALYPNTAALDSFKSSLQAAGYVNPNGSATASSGAQAFVSAGSGHLAILLSAANEHLIEEMTVPTG